MKGTLDKVVVAIFGTLVAIGVIFMIATAVQDCRARAGMFTTSGQVREYLGSK